MRTIEVKDKDGNVIAGAEIEDHVHIGRLMHRLDKRRQQRSMLGQTIRDHFPKKQGEDIACKCGAVFPNAGEWAGHVAHVLVPAAT